MQPARKSSPGLWFVVTAGWLVFVWSWIRVAQETSAGTVMWGVVMLVATTAIVVGVTVWWVVHNLGIYRRKGPRRSVPLAMPDYRTDFVGRDLDGDWMLLRRSSVVVVRMDDGGKRFVPGVESACWGLPR